MSEKAALQKLYARQESWILTDKNRYAQDENVFATLYCGYNLKGDNLCSGAEITIVLIDPRGNRKKIFDTINTRECRTFSVEFEVERCGMYTVVGQICRDKIQVESDLETAKGYEQICSTCFFVGRRSAPAAEPSEKVIFIPEDWEEPESYKLASVFITEQGQPIPFVPITLVFCNEKETLFREIFSDRNGNVFFLPYAEGTYCLIYQPDKAGDNNPNISATFSFSIPKTTE